MQQLLDSWVQVQSTWLYMEPIFSSDDIVKQMPEEGQKFMQVDTAFSELMGIVVGVPAVIPIARNEEHLQQLVRCEKLLDEVQKGLSSYLEKKRLFFPRFFFLSNDEMLEVRGGRPPSRAATFPGPWRTVPRPLVGRRPDSAFARRFSARQRTRPACSPI